MSCFDLLIELGTEELPPKSLKKLSNAFSDGVKQGLTSLDLDFSSITSFAAPRRLAVRVNALQSQQADKYIERLGPNVKAAYDKDGNPSKAAEGFARSNGVSFLDLITVDTPKGSRLAFQALEAGQPTLKLIQGVVEKSLQQLPISKRMRWGASRSEFVRPVQWLVALANNDIIPMTLFGINSDRYSMGHRSHANHKIAINSPESYERQLSDEGRVIASFEERRNLISDGAKSCALAINGQAVIDEDLLDEVTGLVELPVAMSGSFEEDFLSVPAEALISSMKEHQKYFHVVDQSGQLMPNFVFISNIESSRPASVIEGNEKVIRPRLADAAFFFKTDKKRSLESRLPDLDKILFQKSLGTVKDKSYRIANLAKEIAIKIGADSSEAFRAGELCKADLSTDMVLEFDDLQGIAGSYYAAHDGESINVAKAITEQYLPKFSGDALPSTLIGSSVALADRIDTLCGIFAIGQIPSGSKDPFVFLRASIGILRIIVEKKLDLNLANLITISLRAQSVDCDINTVSVQIIDYMFERFRAWYLEEGVSAEVVNAVLAKKLSNPLDFSDRINAVTEFASMSEAPALAAANKRVANILAKADDSNHILDASLFIASEEGTLFNSINQAKSEVAPLLISRDYKAVFRVLASMRNPVDAFFDNVMVNDENLSIRNNRLSLLKELHLLFGSVADIARLVKK